MTGIHLRPVEWLLAALVICAVLYHLIVGGRALDEIDQALRLEQDEQDAFGAMPPVAEPSPVEGRSAAKSANHAL